MQLNQTAILKVIAESVLASKMLNLGVEIFLNENIKTFKYSNTVVLGKGVTCRNLKLERGREIVEY